MLISSGLSIMEVLDSIESEARTNVMKRVIQTMKDDINSGYPLWNVLERSRLFPKHAISLIKLGEESGNLDKNLQVVSEQQVKEKEFRSKVRSAMMYPVFVLGLTGLVGLGIAWFILPRLSSVFGQMSIELPKITIVLIGVGEFLDQHGSVAVPSFIALMILFVLAAKFVTPVRHAVQAVMFAVPGIGALMRQIEVGRFTYLLGTLLGAGMPVVEAIYSVRDATQFPRYQKFLDQLGRDVEEGKSFRESFTEYENLHSIVPVPVQQFIIAGERSGNLPESMIQISDRYDAKVDTAAKNLATMLEPVLLVIVWLGVVAVALAVILPIYTLVGDFNSGL